MPTLPQLPQETAGNMRLPGDMGGRLAGRPEPSGEQAEMTQALHAGGGHPYID